MTEKPDDRIAVFRPPRLLKPRPPGNGPETPPEPLELQACWFALFRNVKNAAELQRLIKTGDAAGAFPDCCVLDAAALAGEAQLQASCLVSLLADADQRRRTHSLTAELLYNLSGSTHIADALRYFGVSAATSDIIVILVADAAAPQKWAALAGLIEADLVPFDQLASVRRNYVSVCKALKIPLDTPAEKLDNFARLAIVGKQL